MLLELEVTDKYKHCINTGTNMPVCCFLYCTHFSMAPSGS